MKSMIKRFSLLTVLVALFAALTVAAYAVDPAPSNDFDMSLVFTPETQLTVYLDGEWNAERSDNYGFGETATITAPAVSGKSFSHWTADGSIVSYANPLKLTMNAHTTLYAVYATTAPTAKPVAGFTSVTRTNGGGKIAFQAIASGDTAGIVYSTTVTGNNLTIGGTGVTQVAAEKLTDSTTTMPDSFLDGNNCWMLQITPESTDTVYHARAYVTVGDETTYGDVMDVKLSDLQSGISLVANLEGFEPGINDKLAGLTNGMLTVTFEPNGGVGATMTQAFISGQQATLRANTFTREGYTFNGWNTAANGSGTAYADNASVTLTADTTLYAQWRSNSSGGGYTPSGGGNNSSTPATTITVPVTGDTGSVSVSASVKGDEATIAPMTAAQVDSIIGSNNAGDNQSSTVEIDVSGLGTEVNTVTIPADTVKAIEAAVSDPEKDADSLTVKLSEGSITFDADALKAIAEQTKSDGLKINLDGIGAEQLNTAQKSAVSDLTVETVLDAYVTSGSTRISDFKGGSATVSVKHTLKADQRPAGIVVWYIADNGTRTQIPATFRNGEVVFTVTHFSNYVIAYDAERAENSHLNCPKDNTCPISAFTDASATAWYHDGVHFALENGIMSGYGNGKFGPGDTTSRAMMAQILWNMEGKPVVNYAMTYTDVDGEAWYAEAVRWATSEKIMSGYGYNKFGPNDDLTREQLVTIVYRYAQYKGIDVSVGEDTNILSYDDAFDVSDWAMEAMQWAVGAGIVNGTSASTLSPKNNASRAEIATIVMRYCTEIAK